MLSTPIRALLGVLAAIAVVFGFGYATGEFDRFIEPPSQQVSAAPPVPQQAAGQPAAQPASANPAAGVPPQPPVVGNVPAAAEPTTPEPATAGIVPPSFDILRVEPDGSIVIAGKAPGSSKVEVLAGSNVVGSTVASKEGDFVVVIDNPLAPGSYQLVLRASDGSSSVAMSSETAVVSIPEKADGQVLALVEQPGQPSKLITIPEPMTSTPAGTAAAAAAGPATAARPAETAAATEPAKPAETQQSAATDPAPAPAQQTPPAAEKPADVAAATPQQATPAAPKPGSHVEVRAIEIEGNKVFVAGIATPRKAVRAYANELMLGETRASETGEFLIEGMIDLPVGDYIVRADLLEEDGNKVLMRAQVPFRREAGEAISAVAPAPKQATDAAAPAAEPNPAATAQASNGSQPATAARPAAPQGGTQVATTQPEADAAAPKADASAGAEPPSVTAEPLQAVDGAVIIRRGDSLWRISRRVYGRGVRYSTIYLANQQQIADPDRIWPGQVFTVPVKTSEGETADMEAIADQKASPQDTGNPTAVR